MTDSPLEEMENHEHMEHAEHASRHGGGLLSWVSMTIAVLAVLSAVIGSLETVASGKALTDSSAPAGAASPTAQPAPVADAPDTPLGLGATQDNKGNVQIEPCGQNLCGYAEKTREPILINMKPASNGGTLTVETGNAVLDQLIVGATTRLCRVLMCRYR